MSQLPPMPPDIDAECGILKLYLWLNGDNEVEPDAYDNLQRTADQAREVAKRALEYAAKCDYLLAQVNAS